MLDDTYCIWRRYLLAENRWNGKKFCDAKFSLVASVEPGEIDKEYAFGFRIETGAPFYTCARSFTILKEEYTQKFVQFRSRQGDTCGFQEIIKNVSPLDIKVNVSHDKSSFLLSTCNPKVSSLQFSSVSLKVTVRSRKPFPTIATLFNDLASPELVDFTIKVDDEEFKTHKFILSGEALEKPSISTITLRTSFCSSQSSFPSYARQRFR
jgi:hypothetical protein